MVLLGDLFTRGPDPVGVWKLIEKWDAEAVLGNHDLDVLKTWKPGKQLPKKAFKWLLGRPWAITGKGWLAVHGGVHPRKGLDGTKKKQAIHMRQWERKGRRDWWWKFYDRDDLVLHGHSKAHGLSRRRPRVVGLDTDCARGGWLTGFVVERERVVRVRAGE